jgi:glycosyltransferase involved in cell wall biosynthesis
MSAKVSVVIPAYNNADYLRDTIKSVQAQTYTNLEIIISDHSSDDDTWGVMQEFAGDPRITLMATPSGGGARRNWNVVSEAATGEYLKLVCGDDLLHSDAIADQLAAIEGDDSVVLVASARDIVDAHGRPIVRRRGLYGLRGKVSGSEAIRTTVIAGANIFGEPACVLMRRSALESAGWWDDTFPYLIDESTYARVLLAGDFVALPKSLASFRVNGGQWSVRLAAQQSAQASRFHAWVRATHPSIVSARDVAVGDIRAWGMALVRRAAYIWLRNRMDKEQ